MNWKIKIAIVIALLVFAFYAIESYNYVVDDPSEVKLNISSEVEKLGNEEKINVSKQGYLKYTVKTLFKSTERVTIGSNNASDFISTIKNEGLTEVYFVFENQESVLTKKYWTLSENVIFEYKETYRDDFDLRSVHTLQGHDDYEVIFEKDYFWTPVWLVFIIGVYSLISACITYVILLLLQVGYEAIFNR
ncbi:hypothetical protein KAS31_02295 [Candidatus Parcubacteria bacterium]|nr:hypothetical protein [Candidatus Parcubacteria bacterium]